MAAGALLLVCCEPRVLGKFDLDESETHEPDDQNLAGASTQQGGAAGAGGVGGDRGLPKFPTAVTDHYCLTQGETLTVSAADGLLANDEGDGALAASASEISVEGQELSVSRDGSFTYVPREDFFGADRFEYALVDEWARSTRGFARLFVAPTHVESTAIVNGIGGYVIDVEPGVEQAEQAVAMAGDVNGDGFGDMVIGAHGSDPFDESRGRAYVVFGVESRNGLGLNGLPWSKNGEGFILEPAETNSNLGTGVSGAGDVNGDGLADVIVGAPLFGEGAGRAYVVFGREDFGTDPINLADLAADDNAGGFAIDAAGEHAGFVGQSVAGGGDVNNDGLDDLIVGAIGAEPNGVQSGRAYVILGKADGAAVNLETLASDDSSEGFAIDGEAENDRVGWTTGMAGDVNGDGHEDVIVGTNMSGSLGRAYVVFGKADGAAVSLSTLATSEPPSGYSLRGDGEHDLAGRAVAGAGDFDGDGLADVLVGAATAGDTNSGRAYVVFGSRDNQNIELGEVLTASNETGLAILGPGELNATGASVSSAGDVNRDGFDDVVLWGNESHVVFGRPQRENIQLAEEGDGTGWFSVSLPEGGDVSFTSRLVGGGSDVNADGFDDVILGQTEQSQSHVIFGGACLAR